MSSSPFEMSTLRTAVLGGLGRDRPHWPKTHTGRRDIGPTSWRFGAGSVRAAKGLPRAAVRDRGRQERGPLV